MAKKATTGATLSSLLQTYSAEKTDVMIPTGIVPIDELWGGGTCAGSMYGLWGPQGSGKSTAAIQIMKSFLSRGERCAWIDVEKALNANQQRAFGIRDYVENGLLLHLQASTYAEADEITTAIANDEEMDVKLVIVDSETMLMPKIGDDAKVDDMQPGQKARQCGTWLTKVKGQFFNKGITMIVLFHARANISMTANPYAPKDKQAGGFAALHIPDCILQMQPGQKFGEKGEPDGQVIHMQCDKNKFAAPFKKIDAKLYFGKGINSKSYLIDWAIANGVITQSGAFYTFEGVTCRGQEALYQMSESDLQLIRDRYEAMHPKSWE